MAQWTLVQKPFAVSSSADVTSLAPAWTNPTVAGNLLLLFLAAGGSISAISPPDVNWILAQHVNNLYIYYKKNAASESGAHTWSWTGGFGAAAILEERTDLAGLATLGLTPVTNTAASGTTATTGTLGPGVNNGDLLVAPYRGQGTSLGAPTFSAYTNSFTEDLQKTGSGSSNAKSVQLAVSSFITTGSGSFSTGATLSVSRAWDAILANFTTVAAGGSKLRRNCNMDGNSASGGFFADPMAALAASILATRIAQHAALRNHRRKVFLP